MNNKKTIVTISGAIGVGKTEVLKHLQNIGYDLIPSVGKSGTAGIINNIQLNGPATENDVLTDQHWMIADRLINYRYAVRLNKNVLMDRGFIDALVFTHFKLHYPKNFELLDYYKPMVNELFQYENVDHLFINLTAKKEVIYERIAKRSVLNEAEIFNTRQLTDCFSIFYGEVCKYYGITYVEVLADGTPEATAEKIKNILGLQNEL